jgi:hypothetical protein
MNPLNEPFVEYLRVLLGKRLAVARSGDGGASAIEWAIITGLLALIALAIYIVIRNKITSAANNIKTGP